jgi:hypothetical protein
MLDYQPGGLYALSQEQFFSWNNGNWTGPNLGAAHFYITWFTNPLNLLNFISLIFLGILVFAL